MSARLNPYISFTDNCREAMDFYASVFGGTPEVMTFGQMGDEGPNKDLVMHAALITPDGFAIFASDSPPEMRGVIGDNVSISVSGDDDLSDYWRGLSEGGNVTMPFEKQMWGDTFGMVTDKFGVHWMVNQAGSVTE